MEEAKAILRKIRGTDNIEVEFEDLVEASEIAKGVKHPFRNLLKPRNRPQLIITCALQFFQQFTGINAIMFYSPVLFTTLGFGSDASLYSAVITGGINMLSTLVSIYSVDKLGRRILLLEACVQMFLSQVYDISSFAESSLCLDEAENMARPISVFRWDMQKNQNAPCFRMTRCMRLTAPHRVDAVLIMPSYY
jgi:hypothetical protein